MKRNMHTELLLDAYHEQLPLYEKLKSIVVEQIYTCLHENHIRIAGLESRIKEEKSLANKLELKGYKYHSINDVTDIVGIRVITFFSDEVDIISALVEQMFDIDFGNRPFRLHVAALYLPFAGNDLQGGRHAGAVPNPF